MAVISRTQVEIYFGPVKNVGIYIYGFIITCMLHVYTLYTLHNTLNNETTTVTLSAHACRGLMTMMPRSGML